MKLNTLSIPLIALFVLIFFSSAYGGTSLLISKTRVVFEKRHRADTILLKNTGDETGKFRMYIENKGMGADGHIRTIDKPSLQDLAVRKMIRFSPRLIELRPGATQTLRVMVRKPEDLAPGEYICHLVFQGRTQQAAPSNSGSTPKNQVGVSFTPILEYAIPIIIRQGEVHATARIGNMTFVTYKDKGAHQLKVTLEREGNRSLYGDLAVFANDLHDPVGMVRGIALYTTTASRPVVVPLDLSGVSAPQNGIDLMVRFTENKKFGGDQEAQKRVRVELVQ